MDDLFPERHLLLRVPPEPVPADDILRARRGGQVQEGHLKDAQPVF